MLRVSVLASAVLLAPLPLAAQAATPDPEILATVQRLFDGMRTKDTAGIRALFDTAARLVSVGARPDGTPNIRSIPISGFVRSIGGATVKLDERISNPEVRQDGGLATVWTAYTFYADTTLSHCGVDSFQLTRTPTGWKIVAIADTQRRQGCTP